MKRGDLVRSFPLDGEKNRESPVFSKWENKSWSGNHIGYMFGHEIGIILDTSTYTTHDGYTIEGVKVLTSSGLVGWVWRDLIGRVK